MRGMNDTLKTIADRFTCRSFLAETPGDEALKTIANAGLQAPSAMNVQPWQIILVKDKKLIEEMDTEAMAFMASSEEFKTLHERIITRGGKLFYNAPCLYVVTIEAANKNAPMDCGIVVQNMALAATSLGLGNAICGLFAFVFAGKRGDEFKQRLGMKNGHTFGISMLVGIPGTKAAPHEIDPSKVSVVG